MILDILKNVFDHTAESPEAVKQRRKQLFPMLAPNAPLRFDVWLNEHNSQQFWQYVNKKQGHKVGKPIWSSNKTFDLKYSTDK